MKKPQHGAIDPDFYGDSYWNGDAAVEGGYHGCNWEGWGYLVDSILDVFHFSSLLDVGCGLGSLLQEAGKREIAATGFDYSGYCSDNPIGGNVEKADLVEPVEDRFTHQDIICCFSVLEHIALDYLPIAIANLGRMAANGILLVKVDLLDNDWKSVKENNIDDRTFTFDAVRSNCDNDLAKALIASGHQTVLPYKSWEVLLDKKLGLKRRPDLERAIFSRCGHRLKWDNFMCFTNRDVPLLRTVWAIDRPETINVGRICERMHHGDIVGLCGYDNIRDQWKNWQLKNLPPPAFIVHADHIKVIVMDFQADDHWLVTNNAANVGDPWKVIGSDQFVLTRPRPYY